MAIFQGRKTKHRKKRKHELGSTPIKPKLSSEEKRKKRRVRGGRKKQVSLAVKYANISVGGKTKRVEIKAVDENPANKDFKRENVLSRGGIIETELGKARITSRPSQDGVVNAVLLK